MEPFLTIVVLISGQGTNLQAIIDAIELEPEIEIRAVISNNPTAYGLQRAQQANIPTHVVAHQAFPNRSALDIDYINCTDF